MKATRFVIWVNIFLLFSFLIVSSCYYRNGDGKYFVAAAKDVYEEKKDGIEKVYQKVTHYNYDTLKSDIRSVKDFVRDIHDPNYYLGRTVAAYLAIKELRQKINSDEDFRKYYASYYAINAAVSLIVQIGSNKFKVPVVSEDAIAKFKFKGIGEVKLKWGTRNYGLRHIIERHAPSMWKELPNNTRLFLSDDPNRMIGLMHYIEHNKTYKVFRSGKYVVVSDVIEFKRLDIKRQYFIVVNPRSKNVVSFYPTNRVPIDKVDPQMFEQYYNLFSNFKISKAP